jgi:pimeloyl-ACP methyl ester carboxylesterase
MNEPAITETRLSSFDGVGLRVYHSQQRAESGVLLIVLPLGIRASLVAPAVRQLAYGFTVITWEGRLVLEPEVALPSRTSLSIEANTRDALVILDHFGVSGAFMIGYCSGATTALHVAAAAPGRIRKLALVNGAYFIADGQCTLTQYEKDIFDIAPQIASGLAQAKVVFNLLQSASLRKRSAPAPGGEIYGRFDDAECLHRFGIGLCHLIGCDARHVARQIDAPTLLIAGKRDEQTHYSSSILIGTDLHEGTMLIDEDGDHYEFCRARPDILNPITTWFATH